MRHRLSDLLGVTQLREDSSPGLMASETPPNSLLLSALLGWRRGVGRAVKGVPGIRWRTW